MFGIFPDLQAARETWTACGISESQQEGLVAEITAKAQGKAQPTLLTALHRSANYTEWQTTQENQEFYIVRDGEEWTVLRLDKQIPAAALEHTHIFVALVSVGAAATDAFLAQYNLALCD